MSFNNEEKDEKEKKDPLDFDFELPDLGLNDDFPLETPPTAPPSAPPPSIAPPIAPLPAPAALAPAPTMPSGPSQAEFDVMMSQFSEKDNIISQLQSQINDLNAQISDSSSQLSTFNSQLTEKDNEINQIKSELQSIHNRYQGQIDQIISEKAQLEAQIPAFQSQIEELHMQNSLLQQQVAPLQSQIDQLRQDLDYKEKRIKELQEPQAVMPSTLSTQGVSSPGASVGSGMGYGTSAGPVMGGSVPSITPTPRVPSKPALSGRRECPNCGAHGPSIKEVEDKTKIISYIPKPIYAKKNVCLKCGYEF